MRNIGLPLCGPAKHAIEDFFDLIPCHGTIISQTGFRARGPSPTHD